MSVADPQADPNNDLLDEDDVLSEAREALKTRLRLRLPKRPTDENGDDLDPPFPSDITKLTSDELGRLQGQFSAMAAYAYGRLAMLDVAHEASQHNEKIARTMASLGAVGSIKDREAKGLIHKESRARSHVYFAKLAQYKLTRAIADGYDRKAKALSREITRRQGDLERDRE